MLDLRYSARFKRDYKKIIKRGYNPQWLQAVLNLLCQGDPLPERYYDHPLTGNYSGYRECHIAPDWLLIYKLEQDCVTLTLTRTGSHSDLF